MSPLSWCGLERSFCAASQKQFPEIVDFYLPPEGCSYRMAVVSIRKEYPGHAKRIMLGIWSFLRQFMYTKFIVITDEDVDVRSWEDVIWAMTTRMDPRRDSVFIDNTPIDYLDFASPVAGLGSKVGMDATNKWEGETDREWGTSIQMDATVKSAWTRFGILSASTYQGANAKTFDPNGSQGCHHKGCWLFPIVLNQGFLCVTLRQ